MPRSSIWFFASENPCISDLPLAMASFAIAVVRSSTAPPPTVPIVLPSAKTAIFAPAPRGAEPLAPRMVQSAAVSPRRSAARSASNSSFINALLSLWILRENRGKP